MNDQTGCGSGSLFHFDAADVQENWVLVRRH